LSSLPLTRVWPSRPADQDEEGGLESIQGVVVIPQDAATDAPHHWGVPQHKHFHRRLVTAAEEELQELPIGQPRIAGQKHGPAKVPDDPTGSPLAMPFPSEENNRPLLNNCRLKAV
jgi:hypothetical protein